MEEFYSIHFRDRTESAVPPSSIRATTALPAVRGSKKSNHPTLKPWDLAPVWIESIAKEEATRKQWEQMYGWMAGLDTQVLVRFVNEIKRVFRLG